MSRPFSDVVHIDNAGFIRWQRRKIFISSALRNDHGEDRRRCTTHVGAGVSHARRCPLVIAQRRTR
jgi:hypothetical protein